ncbi:Tfb2-domain-containing protein [Cutaneotrichosporon oleaginosum]|uniref:RNA polymerase II transcription factor B subunit 2 n=1 Tax=Cutaneotrichosporon oleaginosum TaxID=879819 RepID=A0A0J0XVV2_9TREE|nr:Tfb2-domain-containing protein [Cutaneotrichosporon oleaginosum]KLT45196.1 Tfb2-domain-containing protein [Cutaneotrichosporon oleaginosum]
MVLPSFNDPSRIDADGEAGGPSPTAPLDRFLDSQPATFYEAIYQLLPPVCRQIILHVLWSHQTLKSSELKAFCGMDERLPPEAAEEILRPALARHIFHPLSQKGTKAPKFHWPLRDTFKRGMRNVLTGQGTSNSFGVPFEGGGQAPSQEDLIGHGEDSWEAILKYMVSSGKSRRRPQNAVLDLLCNAGLLRDKRPTAHRSYETLDITAEGFSFLLEDRQTQLWQILVAYIVGKQARGENAADVLTVFFSLGCMQLGQCYSASKSFPRSQDILEDLEQYGFIYRSPHSPDQFFPTHLATSLCSGDLSESRSRSADDKRFLILETNYKIYAYTSNELEIEILNLFVDIKIRYPNLVVGKLDRQNVKQAMDKGISASQIISYLTSHAHPQMFNHPPPLLHASITDQLHLWDRERNRLDDKESVMFEFFSKELFDEARDEATRMGVVLLALPKEKLLFVDPDSREAMKDFIKEKQEQLRSGY